MNHSLRRMLRTMSQATLGDGGGQAWCEPTLRRAARLLSLKQSPKRAARRHQVPTVQWLCCLHRRFRSAAQSGEPDCGPTVGVAAEVIGVAAEVTANASYQKRRLGCRVDSRWLPVSAIYSNLTVCASNAIYSKLTVCTRNASTSACWCYQLISGCDRQKKSTWQRQLTSQIYSRLPLHGPPLAP